MHETLSELLKRIEEAQAVNGRGWSDSAEYRTPRMADVTSLLDRARTKVVIELKRHHPKPPAAA
jgi:hypothetical protein